MSFASAISAVSSAAHEGKTGLWALWSGGSTSANDSKVQKGKGHPPPVGTLLGSGCYPRPAPPRKRDTLGSGCCPRPAPPRKPDGPPPLQPARCARGGRQLKVDPLYTAPTTPSTVAAAALAVHEPRLRTVEVAYKQFNATFQMPDHLEYVRGVGRGAYGIVGEFKDAGAQRSVAVKRVGGAFDDLVDGKRILREVKLLQSLDHTNIVKLLDLYTSPGPDFEDLYIVTELIQTDLARVIRSPGELTEKHHSWFTYQMLCGVLYLHSAGVTHRDLKPGNILVNKDCSLKICDFGLARGGVPAGCGALSAEPFLTEYVVTRYYRAPEIVLLAAQYGFAIDIWSIGCILCELLSRKPVFRGKDYMDQLRQIFEVLGSPSEEDQEWLQGSQAAERLIGKFVGKLGTPWKSLYPAASDELLDAIANMVCFNPLKRLAARDCLRLPFFEDVYQESDEVGATAAVDWSFDLPEMSRVQLQNCLRTECLKFPTVSQEQARTQERHDARSI